jgi:glycosyltransferase involved in cell wall biosynthesis
MFEQRAVSLVRTSVPARRPLRICHVVEATSAGVGRHALDLCEGLTDRGHSVHLVYSPLRADQRFLQRLGRGSYKIHSMAMRRSIGPRDAGSAVSLRGYLKKHGPFDIVHGHSSKGGAIARLAAGGTRNRVVYTPNAFAGMDLAAGSIRRLLFSAIERLLSWGTDAIVCVSPEEREFATLIGLASGKLKLVPNGIEPASLPSRGLARQTLGLRSADQVIGFVGRLAPQKAPDVLLRAFAKVRLAVPGVILAMVGEGPLFDGLQRLAVVLGIADSVRWLGWRDGRSSMPAFDVLALPSRYEGFPYVGLEARAAGLPIVATASSCCRLLIDDGVDGYVVPAGGSDLMAEALVRSMTDNRLLDRCARAAAASLDAFSVRRMVDQTVNVYQSVLEPGLEAGDDSVQNPEGRTDVQARKAA